MAKPQTGWLPATGETSDAESAVHQRADIAEVWRKGLAEELLDGTGFSDDSESPFRAMALILFAAVTIWVLLGLLAFASYSYLTG